MTETRLPLTVAVGLRVVGVLVAVPGHQRQSGRLLQAVVGERVDATPAVQRHRAEVRVGERQTATPTVQPLCGTGPGSQVRSQS